MHTFISYAHEDRKVAAAVNLELTNAGARTWWDPSLRVGSRWQQEIHEVLLRSAAVIVLWSEASIRSDWVLVEAGFAAERGLLVPAFIEPVLPPDDFAQYEGAQLQNWGPGEYHPEFANMIHALRVLHSNPALWSCTAAVQDGIATSFVLELSYTQHQVDVAAVARDVYVVVDGQSQQPGKGASIWTVPVQDGPEIVELTVDVDIRALVGGIKRVRINANGLGLVDHVP